MVDLHPDLVPHLRRLHEFNITLLSHKYVTWLGVRSSDYPSINASYSRTRELVEKAVAQESWMHAITLHQRPYRLDALIEYVLGRSHDGNVNPVWGQGAKVEELVEFVWTDSESIHENRDGWLAVFAGRPEGAFLGDREEFDALPDPVMVYRGGDSPDSFLSWTTSYETAEFFARRFQSDPAKQRVVRREIAKSEIFAYYTLRGEAEILSFEGMDE